MGFDFSKYEGGGDYIKADEKKAIAENGIVLKVLRVLDEDDNVFQGQAQPRFVLVVECPNPETGDVEERKLPFPKGTGVDSRDRMLGAMGEYLEGEGTEEVNIKLDKIGRAYIIVEA